MLLLILLLIILSLKAQGTCNTLAINAIIPCHMYFNYDITLKTCIFSSCFTQSPGNPLNQSQWNTCYALCCPSFIIPQEATYSSTLPCYNQFNSTPLYVWALGVIVASILFILCIALPCCVDHKCFFYKLRVNLFKRHHKKQQANSFQRCQSQTVQKRTKRQQQFLASQPQKSTQKAYNTPSQLNSFLHVCMVCKLPQPDCRLLCGHFYHSECLIQMNGDKLCCKACRKNIKFPVYSYCRFCFSNYELKYSMAQLAYQYTCFSCLLV